MISLRSVSLSVLCKNNTTYYLVKGLHVLDLNKDKLFIMDIP